MFLATADDQLKEKHSSSRSSQEGRWWPSRWVGKTHQGIHAFINVMTVKSTQVVKVKLDEYQCQAETCCWRALLWRVPESSLTMFEFFLMHRRSTWHTLPFSLPHGATWQNNPKFIYPNPENQTAQSHDTDDQLVDRFFVALLLQIRNRNLFNSRKPLEKFTFFFSSLKTACVIIWRNRKLHKQKKADKGKPDEDICADCRKEQK